MKYPRNDDIYIARFVIGSQSIGEVGSRFIQGELFKNIGWIPMLMAGFETTTIERRLGG